MLSLSITSAPETCCNLSGVYFSTVYFSVFYTLLSLIFSWPLPPPPLPRSLSFFLGTFFCVHSLSSQICFSSDERALHFFLFAKRHNHLFVPVLLCWKCSALIECCTSAQCYQCFAVLCCLRQHWPSAHFIAPQLESRQRQQQKRQQKKYTHTLIACANRHFVLHPCPANVNSLSMHWQHYYHCQLAPTFFQQLVHLTCAATARSHTSLRNKVLSVLQKKTERKRKPSREIPAADFVFPIFPCGIDTRWVSRWLSWLTWVEHGDGGRGRNSFFCFCQCHWHTSCIWIRFTGSVQMSVCAAPGNVPEWLWWWWCCWWYPV